ncbi:hypothetical protein MMC32_008208 [Xylographa parallela]|nr:hypothetical protein [Xylographa parallela]
MFERNPELIERLLGNNISTQVTNTTSCLVRLELRLRSQEVYYGASQPRVTESFNITDKLCRKIPWRLSRPQKARQRKRLRAVDTVVSVVDTALARAGLVTKAVERWKAEMPKEAEMVPKDKYTMFDRKEKRYRKGVHST